MQRPAPAFGQRNLFGSTDYLGMSPVHARGDGGFNLASQIRSHPDYFNVKPVHGSSPAGSLAADLSQNFRIGDEERLVAFHLLTLTPLTKIALPFLPHAAPCFPRASSLLAMNNEVGSLLLR